MEKISIVLLIVLLQLSCYQLGKIKKYIHIHLSLKFLLISTSIEIEITD